MTKRLSATFLATAVCGLPGAGRTSRLGLRRLRVRRDRSSRGLGGLAGRRPSLRWHPHPRECSRPVPPGSAIGTTESSGASQVVSAGV